MGFNETNWNHYKIRNPGGGIFIPGSVPFNASSPKGIDGFENPATIKIMVVFSVYYQTSATENDVLARMLLSDWL